MADVIGHVAGERPLIIAGHPHSEVGAAVAQLHSLTAADHAAAV